MARADKAYSQENRFAFIMLAPTALIVFLIVIFPVIWNIWLSLRPVGLSDLRDGNLFSPNLTLINYRKVIGDTEFWPSLIITLIYAISGSALSIGLGLVAALLINKGFRFRAIVRGIMLSPYIAPVVAVTFTWSFILDPQLGLLSSLAIPFLSQKCIYLNVSGLNICLPIALIVVILFEGWRYFPFAFLFILARLQAIPEELYQAASVDGATVFQRFHYITLPQLSMVLSSLFLFRFIWSFNKFDDIFLLTRGEAGTKVLSIKVYEYAFGEFDIGASSASAMLLFLVLLIFLVLYFRIISRRVYSNGS